MRIFLLTILLVSVAAFYTDDEDLLRQRRAESSTEASGDQDDTEEYYDDIEAENSGDGFQDVTNVLSKKVLIVYNWSSHFELLLKDDRYGPDTRTGKGQEQKPTESLEEELEEEIIKEPRLFIAITLGVACLCCLTLIILLGCHRFKKKDEGSYDITYHQGHEKKPYP